MDGKDVAKSDPRLPTPEDWLKRLQVVGKAQERYLWIVVTLALFFAALHARMASDPAASTTSITLPFLGLELEAEVIRAAGPVLLSFVLLSFFGALRAFDRALECLNLKGDDVPSGSVEGLDLAPNALDFAVYTTPESPKWLRRVLYFSYPFVSIAILGEAAWIGVAVLVAGPLVSWSSAFVLAAVPLWLAAVYQALVLHLGGRIMKLRKGIGF